MHIHFSYMYICTYLQHTRVHAFVCINKIIHVHVLANPNCELFHDFRDTMNDDDPVDHLWIGLFNEQQFESAESCRVDVGTPDESEINQCRNRFVWVDGSARTSFQPWRSQEPNTVQDRCIRLEQTRWAASPCDIGLGFICRKGMLLL